MRFYRTCGILLTVLLCGAGVSGETAIHIGPGATQLERLAAVELQRYLFVLDGEVLPIDAVQTLDETAQGYVLGTPDSLPTLGEAWPFGLEEPAEDGYVLHSLKPGNRLVAIGGPTPGAVQNGVYGLLDMMGFGFYLSGDTYPDAVPELAQLHESVSPVFAVRGTLPWQSFLNSAATWEWEDYKAYIDQLARMRCNFVGFHSNENDPFTAYEKDGAFENGERLPNTSRAAWGTKPLPSDKFFAGTGQYFSGEYFGAASSFIEDRNESIRAAKQTLQKALAYAKARGLTTCLGFEIKGDALDPAVQQEFEARLRAMLADYPMIDCVWLWEPEAQGLHPGTEPGNMSQWESYSTLWAPAFSNVEDAKRRSEAVRCALFGMQAHSILKAVRPDVKLVMSGWGGDASLQCTDFLPGWDKVLPEDVVFSALDNLRITPSVSRAYGETVPTRQRWPILWYEFDGDQWMPQPNLFEAAGACRDALAKGCQGLLGVHWRTKRVAITSGYCARFAWDPELSVEEYLGRMARDVYGTALEDMATKTMMRLQGLGYRWVGGWGQSECGAFGWQPGNESRRAQLVQIAAEMREELRRLGLLGSIVPDFMFDTVMDAVPGLDVVNIAPDLVGEQARKLVPTRIRPDKRAALLDGIAYVNYVLAFDSAASDFVTDGPLDELILDDRMDEAIARIKDSSLARAMNIYGRQITTKGELGVLATMNTKAWVDLRERLYLEDEDQYAPLESGPERTPPPSLIVLPDRVIVVNPPDTEYAVQLKTRPMGERWFDTTELEKMGRNTYALRFPEQEPDVTAIEFGVELRTGRELPLRRRRRGLSWPEGFPMLTRTATCMTPAEPSVQGAPKAAKVLPAAPKANINSKRNSVVLMWEDAPGQSYTVARNGKPLGVVWDGHFEDFAAPANSKLTYTVTARNVLSGETAAANVMYETPAFPLPEPPEEVTTTTRGGSVVLGWLSNSPVAKEYLVRKFDENQKETGQLKVLADYGQYLQVADTDAGEDALSYTVSAVTADGRVGEPSRKVGVIPSAAPLEPMVYLSFEDDAFLEGLAQLADNALALGGKGWAELPSQPQWNPEDALTVSVWVNLDDLYGMPVLVCKGTWLQSGYFLQIFNRQVRFHIAGVGTLNAGTPAVGRWQMITAVYGGGQIRIYLDGKLAGRKRVAGAPAPSRSPLLLGRYGLSDDVYFVRGMLDDIRIYDTALAPEEVAKIYEESKRE